MSPLNVRVQSEDGQEIYLSVKISNKKDITSNRNINIVRTANYKGSKINGYVAESYICTTYEGTYNLIRSDLKRVASGLLTLLDCQKIAVSDYCKLNNLTPKKLQ